MAPMQADPFDELLRLRELFYDLFGRSLQDFNPSEQDSAWTIPVDVYRTENEIVVECDVPGARVEDLGIEVRGGWLVLEGERRSPEKVARAYRLERRRGSFARRIELPPDVDTDGIEATMKTGVLRISLPLRSAGQRRRVAVQSEGD